MSKTFQQQLLTEQKFQQKPVDRVKIFVFVVDRSQKQKKRVKKNGKYFPGNKKVFSYITKY